MKLLFFESFIPELRELWGALEPCSQHYVFQSFGWVSVWQEMVGEPIMSIRPWIAVVVDAHDSPRLIFPFGVRRRMGARVLEFLGGAQGDYLGPLLHDQWATRSDLLRSAWELVEAKLPAHDVRHFCKLPALGSAGENPWLQIWKCAWLDSSHALRLPASTEELQVRLRTKLKSDNKRQRRRLGEKGRLSFEIVVKGEKWEEAVGAMIAQKRQRYQITGVPDALAAPAVREFYRSLGPNFLHGGQIHLSLLRLNEEILATHWGAVYRDRFYFLMPTYSSGPWGTYSPGRLLLENLLEWAIASRLSMFDFTIGGEEYKKDWCDHETAVYRHLRLITPLGLACFAYLSLKYWARRNDHCRATVRALYSWISRFDKRKLSI